MPGSRMMQNFFREDPFADSFFGDFFSPHAQSAGPAGLECWRTPSTTSSPRLPALTAAPARQQEAKEEKKDDLVGKEEQSRFSHLRQMNALKMELKKAVRQENFERAAELRDQIRSLEAAHKEQKESK